VKTEELVADIARGNRGAPGGARSPEGALLVWMAGSAASIALATWILGPRADLAMKFATPRFVLTLALVVSTTVSAGSMAVLLAFPGRFRPRLVLPALATFLAAWLGALVAFAILESGRGILAAADWGYSCTMFALGIALTPAVVLVALVKRSAPTHPTLNALAIGVAAFGAGALGVHLYCPNDGTLHHIAWHGSPVLAVAALSAAAGWRILRW
jgi:hypothetical protein